MRRATSEATGDSHAMADLDGLGWNPGLKYSYQKDPKDRLRRVLGKVEWKDHALPTAAAELTTEISILQVGEGNEARELRIRGRDASGEVGYFHKTLGEAEWSFQPVVGATLDGLVKLKLEDQPGFLETKAKDYSGKFKNIRVNLKDFTPDRVSSKLKVTVAGNEYTLMLYKRVSLVKKIVRLGRGEGYDIVIPKEIQGHTRRELLRWMGGSAIRGANLTEKDGQLVLEKGKFKLKLSSA